MEWSAKAWLNLTCGGEEPEINLVREHQDRLEMSLQLNTVKIVLHLCEHEADGAMLPSAGQFSLLNASKLPVVQQRSSH